MKTKKIKLHDIKKQRGKTDWNYLKRNEIKHFVDPDAPEINMAQLIQMRKPKKILIR